MQLWASQKATGAASYQLAQGCVLIPVS